VQRPPVCNGEHDSTGVKLASLLSLVRVYDGYAVLYPFYPGNGVIFVYYVVGTLRFTRPTRGMV
jgi:hypothetical protein